jgi:hypothetical protein
MRPLTLAAAASSSWKLLSERTSASTPSPGVPTLLPSPSIASEWRRGATISALSWPRTQCGTLTGSRRTFSKPSFFISAAAQRIAASSDSEPLSRWPKVSVNSASRSHANRVDSDSAISRAAGSRYAASQSVCAREAAVESERNTAAPRAGPHRRKIRIRIL